jgi:hypothetical protein
MTVSASHHLISSELARSRERDNFATCSFTSGFQGDFVAFLHVIGSFYGAPHPLNSPDLIACGDLFDPSQPRAVLQCP